MRSAIRLYKTVAILSFVILAAVQFFLVYNTYRLKDEQHYFEEKEAINNLYRQSVANDKIFPGGQAILDKYLKGNIRLLEELYATDKRGFSQLSKKVCDSIFTDLRRHHTLDSLVQQYKEAIDYKGSLHWLSLLEGIAITFDGSTYIPLFQLKEVSEKGLKAQNNEGVIAGSLSSPDKTNLVTAVTVSSPTAYSNRITFSLYADSPYRMLMVFKKMLPVLLLALFSIFCVAAIFYLTFRNWVKQKKLAEMKSDFVNSITHEFNTPLASIIVANKSLQNEKIMEDRQKVLSLTAVIHRQSQRLKALFGQVLDLTLMNASSLQKEEVVIEDMLEEIITDYRILIQDNNVSVNYLKKIPGHKVALDRFWATTMIINLLDNGIKYNNNRQKVLSIFTKEADKKLEVHIADNGIGIPEEITGQIFDKFYRSTKNMESNATNGLGLGLFYVRQCVNAHGWEIAVRSAEKEGSEFIIYIPVA